MKFDLTPTEVSLLAAAVNDKIALLDAARDRLIAERERLGLTDTEAETIGLLVRSTYDRLARQLQQRLDVPFMDNDDALALLLAEGTVVVALG